MTVPAEVAGLLRGRPQVGEAEQAFPFMTVDGSGFPHVALLSRAELDITADNSALLAAVYSRRTRRNVERDGRAGLIAVEGTTAHYLKLEAVNFSQDEGLAGMVFRVSDHTADSLGIALDPIRFTPTEEIARSERWDRSQELLNRLVEA